MSTVKSILGGPPEERPESALAGIKGRPSRATPGEVRLYRSDQRRRLQAQFFTSGDSSVGVVGGRHGVSRR